MGYVKFEIRHYKKTGENSWSSTYNVIPIGSVDLKEGIEATKDTFKFSVINANAKYKDTFSIDDRIALYMWRNKESADDNDLVIDGMITQIKQTISAGGRKMTINGANRTQYLLGSLVRISFIAENHKCYQAIQEVIKKVNNNNQANPGDEKYINYTAYVATKKRDGSDFPDKSFVWAYQPAYQAIEKWSTDEYTKDGGYIFWVDTNGNFHWQAKPSSASYSFTEGDTKINKLDIQEGTWDAFNAVIISVGRDCYGHGNHALVYNPVSMVDIGTKWKFINKESITAELINKEINENKDRFSLGDDNEPTSLFPTSYPYDMQFYLLDSSYNELGTKTVNNDAEFNLQIRRKARKLGKEWGNELLKHSGEVQFKVNIELNGTLDYVKGNMLTLTAPSHNLLNKKLRIMDIQHRFDTAGWTTILKTEEDFEYSESG